MPLCGSPGEGTQDRRDDAVWPREGGWGLFGKHGGWLSPSWDAAAPDRGAGLVRRPSGLLCLLAMQGPLGVPVALRHLSPLPFLLEALLPSVHPIALVGELCILLAVAQTPPHKHDPQGDGLALVPRSRPEAGLLAGGLQRAQVCGGPSQQLVSPKSRGEGIFSQKRLPPALTSTSPQDCAHLCQAVPLCGLLSPALRRRPAAQVSGPGRRRARHQAWHSSPGALTAFGPGSLAGVCPHHCSV